MILLLHLLYLVKFYAQCRWHPVLSIFEVFHVLYFTLFYYFLLWNVLFHAVLCCCLVLCTVPCRFKPCCAAFLLVVTTSLVVATSRVINSGIFRMSFTRICVRQPRGLSAPARGLSAPDPWFMGVKCNVDPEPGRLRGACAIHHAKPNTRQPRGRSHKARTFPDGIMQTIVVTFQPLSEARAT